MVDKRIKYILYILMIISLFFTIKSKVHALTNVQNMQFSTTTYYKIYSVDYLLINAPSNFLKNYGVGYVNFQMLEVNNVSGTNQIYDITLYGSSGSRFSCTFDSVSNYADNTAERTALNVVCPVKMVNNEYITKLRLGRDGAWGNLDVFISQYWSFTQDIQTSQDISNAINSMSSSIISNNNTTNQQQIQQMQNISTNIQNQTNQQHQDSQAINQSIQDTNNTLKDSSTDNQKAQETFDSLNQNMASNSTISDLLLMPIHLLQKILNGLQGSCSSINVGQLFGEDFILPCINIADIIGSTLWGIIDVICSGFLAYHIGKRFVIIFNQFTNLKEGGLESAYD